MKLQIVATALLCVLLSNCSSSEKSRSAPAPGAEANTLDPTWVIQHSPKAKVAVVFVHGIFGDAIGTWTDSKGKSFFDFLNADPQLGGQLDLFAFGFTSNMFGSSSFSIDEAATRLQERLRYHGVLDYQAVVFVAHSMGGLVVLRTLLTYRELTPKIPLIVLYATPQEGSQIAAISKNLSGNPALQQMIPGDANVYLDSLDRDWKEATRTKTIPIACGYEKRSTYGIKVVTRVSATRYCTEAASAIDADHLSIVKPDRPGHDSIVLLVNALNRYVVGKDLVAKLELPDFVKDSDVWRFSLADPFGRQSARLVNSGRLPLRFTLAELSDPGLYVWPDDTPRTLQGESSEQLSFALAYGASLPEYRFVLRTDSMQDQPVVVSVQNLPEVIAKQKAMSAQVVFDLNSWLSSDAQRQLLAAAAPDDPKVADAVVEQARHTIARSMPNAPASMQWVVTADTLHAANWSNLAVNALRQAESTSPAVVHVPGVQRLATITARASGEQKVFKSIPNPVPLANVADMNANSIVASGWDAASAAELAVKFQSIPALRGVGLSVKGDLAASQGNTPEAHKAYEEAARIRLTPSLGQRLNATAVAPTGAAAAAGSGARELSRNTRTIVSPDLAPTEERVNAARIERTRVVPPGPNEQ
jgi:pimeloyl-ACP methyl ester carboxylesterase